MVQIQPVINILLADDDSDDILLFREVLAELQLKTKLTTVYNGEQLMTMLLDMPGKIPDILFLDLNMPRKNGYECLVEIKKNDYLNSFPVIIFSTSGHADIIKELYKKGAHTFFCKPNSFEELKIRIEEILVQFSQTIQDTPHTR